MAGRDRAITIAHRDHTNPVRPRLRSDLRPPLLGIHTIWRAHPATSQQLRVIAARPLEKVLGDPPKPPVMLRLHPLPRRSLHIHHSLGAGTHTRRAATAPTAHLRFFRIASLRDVLPTRAMSVSPDTDTKLACRNGRGSSGTDRALPLRAPIDPSAPARRGQPERLRLGARTQTAATAIRTCSGSR